MLERSDIVLEFEYLKPDIYHKNERRLKGILFKRLYLHYSIFEEEDEEQVNKYKEELILSKLVDIVYDRDLIRALIKLDQYETINNDYNRLASSLLADINNLKQRHDS